MEPKLPSRGHKGIISAPVKHINSGPDGSGVDSCDFSPFSHSQGFTLVSYPPIVSPVPALRFSGGPNTVSGFIVSIIVFPFNRVFGRRFRPHIRKEVFKFSPSITNFYASISITFGVIALLACAPVNHASPRNVFRSSATTMSGVEISRPAIASTAFCQSRPQPSSGVVFDVSAVALTNPYSSVSGFFWMDRNCYEVPESLAGNIFEVVFHGHDHIQDLAAMAIAK